MGDAANIARPHRGTIGLTDAKIIAVEHFEGAQHYLRLDCPGIAARALPGSFVHLKCDNELPMRRPMSVMRVSAQDGWLDVLYKAHGHGSGLLATRVVGETLSVMGPIGQPFKLRDYRPRPLLIGGGVGMPPMLFLAEHLRATAKQVQPLVLLGSEVPFPFSARPSTIMVPGVPPQVIAAMPLLEDWHIASRLASLAGFAGCFEGYVTDLAREWLTTSGVARDDVEIFACGPTPMLRAVQRLAAELALPCQISLEEYMACAVGGCAGCTVKVETANGPAMKRVCVDGPVFEASTVVI
ncbi:MAG: dihydroorotate dehydrogenase electron transfer subunit [Gammaproteobacteria bacterium]|nr:dihydroorotate dehydrogenase electron transfer subunit [Gammaproteobacteria bacterium]